MQLMLQDFAVMVDGALMHELAKEDRLFQQLSVFAGQQMIATGNLKKNTKIEELSKQLYLPIADRQSKPSVKHVGEEKVNKLRAELAEKMKLN